MDFGLLDLDRFLQDLYETGGQDFASGYADVPVGLLWVGEAGYG